MSKPEAAQAPQIRCKYSKLVPIADLKPNPLNPNTHTSEQLKRFAEILRYQGTRRPFRVSNQSGYLTVGHGQLAAYKLNGWTECPVDFQDYEDAAQEYADLVADNALATWSQLDFTVINEAMGQFKGCNPEMFGIDGFDPNSSAVTFPDARSKNEFTKDEKTLEYMASQSRNVVLVYSLTEFTRMTELMGEVMSKEGLESFSDVVKHLLENYGKGQPKKNKL